MPDELDPLLLRTFAQSQRPLADADFVARVMSRVPAGGSLRGAAATLAVAAAIGLRGLASGIAAPLRLRYAGLAALAGALITALSLLPSL
jgi:hypothetical protein